MQPSTSTVNVNHRKVQDLCHRITTWNKIVIFCFLQHVMKNVIDVDNCCFLSWHRPGCRIFCWSMVDAVDFHFTALFIKPKVFSYSVSLDYKCSITITNIYKVINSWANRALKVKSRCKILLVGVFDLWSHNCRLPWNEFI